MFTGLIEAVGKVVGRATSGAAGKLVVHCETLPLAGIKIGDSIAVNGACLTVEAVNTLEQDLTFHTLAETLSRTNLGHLEIGRPVNLEQATRLGDRLGGHIVTGHIDCTTPVLSVLRPAADWVLTIRVPEEFAGLVVHKGSIAINGVSLTVAWLQADRLSAHIIPHTWQATALHATKVGEPVNLEFDIVGKYILRQRALAGAGTPTAAIDMDTLAEAGFLE